MRAECALLKRADCPRVLGSYSLGARCFSLIFELLPNHEYRLFCAVASMLSLTTASMFAVILYGTGDPNANTTAPTGNLAGSGWQYEGQFGSFLGTVIASDYFVTAKHIGGSVGDTFTFNQVSYVTTAVFPDPSSDLQIWRVAGIFAIHAPLYTAAAGNEAGLNLVVFGRGPSVAIQSWSVTICNWADGFGEFGTEWSVGAQMSSPWSSLIQAMAVYCMHCSMLMPGRMKRIYR